MQSWVMQKPLKGECMTENLNVLRSLVHIGDKKTLLFSVVFWSHVQCPLFSSCFNHLVLQMYNIMLISVF